MIDQNAVLDQGCQLVGPVAAEAFLGNEVYDMSPEGEIWNWQFVDIVQWLVDKAVY